MAAGLQGYPDFFQLIGVTPCPTNPIRNLQLGYTFSGSYIRPILVAHREGVRPTGFGLRMAHRYGALLTWATGKTAFKTSWSFTISSNLCAASLLRLTLSGWDTLISFLYCDCNRQDPPVWRELPPDPILSRVGIGRK